MTIVGFYGVLVEDFRSWFTGVIMFLLHIHWENVCRIPHFFLNHSIHMYVK